MKMKIARIVARASSRLPRWILRRRVGPALEIDGHSLDLHIQSFAQAIARAAARRRPAEITPTVVRGDFRTIVALGGPKPIEAVSVHDRIISGPGGDLPVRLYHPANAEGRAPAIVWYHQGGGVIGGLDSDHGLLSQLAERCGAVVMSVDYRLAPEHKFPAGVDDAQAAHQWMLDNADALAVDPARVAVGGTSHGGTLAAVVCQERRSRGLPQPVAQILVYPGVDATAVGGSRDSCAETWPLSASSILFFGAHYLPDPSAARDERVSPGLATELWGLAPAVVVTAGFDPLRDEGERYASALEGAGVQVVTRREDSLTHSFTALAGISREARRANKRLADDVAGILGVD